MSIYKKNLIMNTLFLLLAILFIATTTSCSRLPRSVPPGLTPRSEPDTIPAAVASNPLIENLQILDQAQFEASGLTLSTLSPPPGPDAPRGRIVCETSSGSPRLSDIRTVYNWLFKFNNHYCCNNDTNGGGCSHITTYGEASCAICGRQDCLFCGDVAWNLYWIMEICDKSGRAGGVSFLNQGSHVVLY